MATTGAKPNAKKARVDSAKAQSRPVQKAGSAKAGTGVRPSTQPVRDTATVEVKRTEDQPSNSANNTSLRGSARIEDVVRPSQEVKLIERIIEVNAGFSLRDKTVAIWTVAMIVLGVIIGKL